MINLKNLNVVKGVVYFCR